MIAGKDIEDYKCNMKIERKVHEAEGKCLSVYLQFIPTIADGSIPVAVCMSVSLPVSVPSLCRSARTMMTLCDILF